VNVLAAGQENWKQTVEISDKLTEISAGYLGTLLHGGSFSLLGQKFSILGLQHTNDVIQQTLRRLPNDAPQRADLRPPVKPEELVTETPVKLSAP